MALQPPPDPLELAPLLKSAAREPLPTTATSYELGSARAYFLNTGTQPNCKQTYIPWFVGHMRVCVFRARCRAQALCPAQYLGLTRVCLTAGLCKQKQKQMRSG